MRRTITSAVVVFALCGAALAGGGDKPRWLKYEKALALARQTGMPICVYNVVTQKGGGC